ncbi:MAG: M20/M25/M40 family metallo-hydrolase [Clostridia bacterium]|nr:M20/M25/M40 family metallo-hydrolase [Clostridia bacterium]
MDLSSIIKNREKYTKYIVDDITYICKNLGKRAPGSEGEKKACEYMARELRGFGCDRVSVESFSENPGSFFGWIYFAVTFAIIGLICIHFAPIVTVIVNLASFVIAILQFGLYKKLMDPFFKKETGHNVTAIKSCKGEVKRRIFFNGHVDAAWEWPVNYLLGGVGFEAHAIIGFGGLAYFLVLGVIACVKYAAVGSLPSGGVRTAALWGLVFLPFWIGLYFMWNRHRIVDGANDNLTGCYMGMAIMKALKEEGIELEDTEVGVIITGSEEAGLRGAKAWAEAHKNDFNDVPTFIYSYDTIHDPKYLMANYRNLNGTVKTDKDLADLFMEAASDLNIHCLKGMVPPMGGATDDAAFAQAGMRATGITGLNHKLEDYYHTRRDTYDNMNEQGIGDCFAVSVKVLEKFANGAKQ